ncbi:putative ATP-dependent DNA helicase CHR12 [Camellia lanceoleosa]|uniref:ATP-dependent DNA helicase CHR12 n=1 Tax=Camellia lanceoleosa TaxID=1840588 RepID=A0ACC0FRI9_9ERIC|nr:putative ATP-dependent DNA helicase CHR12 [Camellia lanceoleosa]
MIKFEPELPSSRGEDLQSKCLLELYGLESNTEPALVHWTVVQCVAESCSAVQAVAQPLLCFAYVLDQ